MEPPSFATRAGVDVDPELEVFVRRLMARDARDRFASAWEALLELDRPQPRQWGMRAAAAVGGRS